MVGKTGDFPFAEDFLHRGFDGTPCFLVHDVENQVHRLAACFLDIPAGERLGDRIHERYGAIRIGGDYRVTDAPESG